LRIAAREEAACVTEIVIWRSERFVREEGRGGKRERKRERETNAARGSCIAADERRDDSSLANAPAVPPAPSPQRSIDGEYARA